MKKVFFILLALVLALSVGLIGCEGEGPEPPEPECNPDAAESVLCNPQGYPDEDCVVEGNVLKILHNSAPGNLGCPWQFSSGFESPQSRFAIERLIGLDENGDLCPQLATSWVSDEGTKTITFTLREGVTFHDDSAFNATVATWVLNKEIDGLRDLSNCDYAEETGDYEVTVHLKDWVIDYDRVFMSTGGGRMVSKAAYDALEGPGFVKDQWMKENPIGTGPFKFVSYDGSTLLVYEAYEDYWQEGLPYLDGVEIHYVPNEMTRLFAFTDGDYHVMNEMSTSAAKELLDDGYPVLSRVVNIMGIGPDSLEPPFDNQDMREMLAMGVDWEDLVETGLDNMMEYTNQLALESVETAGLASGWNASMVGYPYDQDAAKVILEDNGWNTTPLHGGFGSPTNPNPFEVDLVYATQGATNYLLSVQTAFWEIGVDMVLTYMERSPWSELCGDGWDDLVEYQFSYNCFELSYPESLTMGLSDGMQKYASIYIPTDYTTLYEAMLVEANPTTRATMYKQLNTLAIDKYCLVIPAFGYEVFTARQPTVHNFGYGVVATEFTPEIAWIYEIPE